MEQTDQADVMLSVLALSRIHNSSATALLEKHDECEDGTVHSFATKALARRFAHAH